MWPTKIQPLTTLNFLTCTHTSNAPFAPHSYTAPDGSPIALTFTAGTGGYVATGDVLPVAPALPYTRNDHHAH